VADTLTAQATLAGWAAPLKPNGGRVNDNESDLGAKKNGTKAQIDTSARARLAGWPAVKARDHHAEGQGQFSPSLPVVSTLAAHGPESIGFLLGPNGWEIRPASGQLNGHHSRFLMGLPMEWCEAAILAFRSLKSKKRAR
jgi:hypothetical protein